MVMSPPSMKTSSGIDHELLEIYVLYVVRYYYALDVSHIVGPPINLCNEDTQGQLNFWSIILYMQ